MNKLFGKGLVSLFVFAALSVSVLSVNAYPWGWSRALPASHNVVVLRGVHYHYYRGRFYRPGPVGFFIVTPPIGVVVTVLPPVYRTVIIGGVSYYYDYDDNVYYTDSPSGYVVVPAPVQTPPVVVQPASTPAAPTAVETSMPGKSIIVNVPNENGSFTPVKLVKYKNGYVGPQGEFYAGHPTIDQLSVLYGK